MKTVMFSLLPDIIELILAIFLESSTNKNSKNSSKPSGKCGKLAKSDAHNLLERLKKHEVAVLDSHVSFTNNRAEWPDYLIWFNKLRLNLFYQLWLNQAASL